MIEVTTPAASKDLITSDEALYGWNGTTPDAEVTAMAVTAASITASLWCRREFVSQVYTELLEAPERHKLVLAEGPVTDVTSVESDGEAITNYKTYSEASILLKTDDIPWTGPIYYGGPLRATPLISDRSPKIEVVYTAGYITQAIIDASGGTLTDDDLTIPADIRDAVAELARELIKKNTDNPVGDPRRVKVGSFEVGYGKMDTMTGSGSGYWADHIGDPSILWLPLKVRRALMHYRRSFL